MGPVGKISASVIRLLEKLGVFPIFINEYHWPKVQEVGRMVRGEGVDRVAALCTFLNDLQCFDLLVQALGEQELAVAFLMCSSRRCERQGKRLYCIYERASC